MRKCIVSKGMSIEEFAASIGKKNGPPPENSPKLTGENPFRETQPVSLEPLDREHIQHSKRLTNIDKTYNIPFSLKNGKTKQTIDVNRDSLFSKFATGKFSNDKVTL